MSATVALDAPLHVPATGAPTTKRWLLLIEDYNDSYTRLVTKADPAGQRSYKSALHAAFDAAIYYGDAYPRAFAEYGDRAEQIIPWCTPLQRRWAREQRVWTPPRFFMRGPIRHPWMRLTGKTPLDWGLARIATAQIAQACPDVLWVFSGIPVDAALLTCWRQYVKQLVLWWSCPLQPGYPYEHYDVILSCIPQLVEQFCAQGIRAAHVPHAFDAAVLQHTACTARRAAVAFVGNLSAAHGARTGFLEALASSVGLELYGVGIEHTSPTSPLRTCYRGPAWGQELYRVYGEHLIVVHKNTDVAGSAASAKRLFEATGMGACVVAEASPDLAALFEPDVEIVTYRSQAECVERVRALLADPARAARIGAAGQWRTLRDHTYARRVAAIRDVVRA